jgi:hypothetical protein
MGQTTHWWWPDFYGIGKWPPGVPRAETIDAFIAAFGTLGYEECADGTLEAGFEKVAIYGKVQVGGSHAPTHIAIQRSDSRWSSKLGIFEDIEHSTLESLFSAGYGTVIARYLKRPRR